MRSLTVISFLFYSVYTGAEYVNQESTVLDNVTEINSPSANDTWLEISPPIYVKQGDKITLHCPEISEPISQLEWTFNGARVERLHTKNATGRFSAVRNILQITNVSLHDSGLWACHYKYAASTEGSNSSEPVLVAHVQVIEQPSFTITRLPSFGRPVWEGQQLSLHCSAESSETSSWQWTWPVWHRDDGSMDGTQTGFGYLNFSAIRTDQSGWYRCTVDSPAGAFSSHGYLLNVRTQSAAPLDEGNLEITNPVLCQQEIPPEPPPKPIIRTLFQEQRLSGIAGHPILVSASFCIATTTTFKVVWITPFGVIRPGSRHERFVAHPLTDVENSCHNAQLIFIPQDTDDQSEIILLIRSEKDSATSTTIVELSKSSTSTSNWISLPASSSSSSLHLCSPMLIAFVLSVVFVKFRSNVQFNLTCENVIELRFFD